MIRGPGGEVMSIGRVAIHEQNAVGGVLDPFSSFLTLRGIRTLSLRMERHSSNALALAQWLEQQPQVEKVWFPWLESHPHYALARRQMSQPGGMISGVIKGDEQQAAAVICPSYYEAGNGPGMDGWIRGVPVLMSDIPAFREHEPFMGVRAGLFEPSDPLSIASAIERLLQQPEEAREDARISQEGIRRHSWDTVAREYGSVFLDACAKSS